MFNLGHGVLPETDPETLERVVDLVHSHPPVHASAADAADRTGEPR